MPKPTIHTLFPSKKRTLPPPKPKDGPSTSTSSPSPTKPRPPRPKPAPAADDLDESAKLPTGPFQEFRLMSSALNGWKYDVMKFDSHKVVDISTWQTPIKLNRKDLRKPGDDVESNAGPVAVGPMMGPDGKPVIGVDGRIVMVDAEGRPIHPTNGAAKGKGPATGAGAAPAKKRFQKKTRQVFLVSEEVRQLRREERYPWVIEDSSGKETWVAKLEEVAQASTRAFFMPAANDVFKFVPAHRWYKFQKKPLYTVWSAEEAEAIYQKHKNNLSPEVWLSRRKGGASAATAAMFKAEAEGRTVIGENSLVETAGTSLGPGGRKLKTVENGMDHLFEDDGEEGEMMKKRRARELGEEGDMDEILFEEDFADDEEPMEIDENDEEAKEQAERMKRDQRAANKTREGYVDADEDDDEGALTKDGKRFKKMLRNRDGNEAYESDDEENPYASSAEEEEEEQLVPGSLVDPALAPNTESRPGSQPPGKPSTPQPNGDTPVKEESPSSPSTPNLSLGGHSVVAKRATSPKAPKLKSTPGSRAGSPLASRASSPTAAGSPGVTGSRATSPSKGSNKRKADEGVSPAANGGPPKPKKRKPTGPPVGELEDRMVIEWLRNSPPSTTRECIAHFTLYLTDDAKKAKFTGLVREIATLKNGKLVLRNAYRNPSAAPSPAPTPAA
ncbi:hypothetical protein HGRIS_010038 [Hohenbuehelia grisea]|uniref:Transcription initiation factor IIF subunit alpha n=1 Tax=Hohenbuehelia grisea TaxID=104357 RepID=A0ABR3J321_9AGAR